MTKRYYGQSALVCLAHKTAGQWRDLRKTLYSGKAQRRCLANFARFTIKADRIAAGREL